MSSPSHQHSRPTTPESIMDALAAPFESQAIRIKPGVVSGNRALAIPYLDARAIQDRLDEVLGLIHWQDEYECMTDGSVICRLRVRINGEWICKVDVGGPSEQPDEGDRRKAAFSDALKRAAVKFGIGRYLHRLPAQWQDFDPVRKQFTKPFQGAGPTANGSGPARRDSFPGESKGREPARARAESTVAELPGRDQQKGGYTPRDFQKTNPMGREPMKREGALPEAAKTTGAVSSGPQSLTPPRSHAEPRRPESMVPSSPKGASMAAP
jgi:hypothetical protein